ncbi:MAG TPA: hypothetical protein VN780_06460 [Candidatus Eisenbacteria bacterium]|jgi:peptidoglycan/LPS O-acetylase OafA/YrhL|nr:hypothetical protein [Candidatus Eisenbacteria bacterium]
MMWFGILAYWWVRKEVAYGKTRTPNRYLVAAGAWSYSLYVVHHETATLFREAAHSELAARGDVVWSYVPAWWFRTCFIF